MPKFILDTAGAVQTPEIRWDDLDAFTQGYIEAAFFTSSDEDGNALEQGFADLAPETLAIMISDCAAFRQSPAWVKLLEALGNEELGDLEPDLAAKHGDLVPDPRAGHDFWFTRNGHGCGFWDGDWPEPHGEALTDAAKAFPECDLYVGDDGKVYL